MDSFNYLQIKQKSKDKSKGQKIAAALYLVTGHLSDTDPLRGALRTHAVTLTTAAHDGHVTSAAHDIETLLGTAVIAGIISEKNASIISLELRHYIIHLTTEADTISGLFSAVPESAPVKAPTAPLSYTPRPLSVSTLSQGLHHVAKNPVLNENKSKRQDAILSFINERKSVGIKDIAALFSDTSEKTIQRELGALVATGKITKRGEKRWSVYMAVL